jgi:hypothetical protein
MNEFNRFVIAGRCAGEARLAWRDSTVCADEDTDGVLKMNYRLVTLALFSVMTLILTGCGGGQSSSNPSTPQSVTVAVSSASSTVLLGNTVQFSATVTGSSNTLVDWSVSGTGAGSINTSGLYSAPADLPKPATVTVTAISQADATKSSAATVTITSDVAVSLSATPSGAASIAFNEALTLAATVASSGKPDTSMAWTVNGVPNGNLAVGTVTISSSTVTYTAPTTPAQVSITATSVADPSKSASLSVNIAALSAGALSNSSPLPLTPIRISTAGLNTTAAVQIRFSNGSGFAATQNPIRVASDGTVIAAVPLYVDAGTGQIGPGTVSVVLTQGNQSTAPMPLNIQDLPPVNAYGTQLGEISRAVLNVEAMLISQELNQLQAFQLAPGNTVDTTKAQATLNKLLNAVIQARSDVDQISLDNTIVISSGTLSDGTPVQFDKTSLDLMDRVSGIFLTQTFGDLILSGTSSHAVRPEFTTSRHLARVVSPPTHIRGRHGQRRIFESQQPFRVHEWSASGKGQPQPTSLPELTFSQAKQLLIAMQTIQATTGFMAEGTASANAKNLSDEGRALAGGFSAALGIFPKSATNEALGGLGSIVSDLDIISRCFAADGEFIAALVTGNQGKINQAVADSNNLSGLKVTATLLDLGSYLVGYKPAAFLGSTVASLLNVYSDGQEIQDLQAVDATGQAIENSFPIPLSTTQGIGEVIGNVNIPTNEGIGAPLSGIELSSNGISFDALADPVGNYQLFVPLQASPFNYGNTDVIIIDPISQSILGSEVVDLSNLTTATPLQIPTIQGTPCSNIDFDGDDPDCD